MRQYWHREVFSIKQSFLYLETQYPGSRWLGTDENESKTRETKARKESDGRQ